MRYLSVALVLLAAVALPASAQTTIDTGLPINLSFGVSGWTVGDQGYYMASYAGQSFTAPTLPAVAMSSFSFGLCCSYDWGTSVPTPPRSAFAWIAEFDGVAITDILYRGEFASSIEPGLPGLDPGYDQWDDLWWATWDVGGAGLALQAGRQYLAFVGVDPALGSHPDNSLGVVYTRHDPYAEGTGYTLQNVSNGEPMPGFEPWYDTRWDVMFSAEFSGGEVVPEPSTIILLGTGLLGLGVVAWRRREDEAE